jgi:hypothetical protein
VVVQQELDNVGFGSRGGHRRSPRRVAGIGPRSAIGRTVTGTTGSYPRLLASTAPGSRPQTRTGRLPDLRPRRSVNIDRAIPIIHASLARTDPSPVGRMLPCERIPGSRRYIPRSPAEKTPNPSPTARLETVGEISAAPRAHSPAPSARVNVTGSISFDGRVCRGSQPMDVLRQFVVGTELGGPRMQDVQAGGQARWEFVRLHTAIAWRCITHPGAGPNPATSPITSHGRWVRERPRPLPR